MPGMKGTMDEWKAGTLHSGSKKGPVVKSQKQAIAIGLSQQRKLGKGEDVQDKEKPLPGAKTVTIRAKRDQDGDYQKVGAGQAASKVGVGAKLNAAARKKLPSSDFALPGKGKGPGGKGAGSYPINDKEHARKALQLMGRGASPSEKATIRAKVKARFPEIGAGQAVGVGAMPPGAGMPPQFNLPAPSNPMPPMPSGMPPRMATQRQYLMGSGQDVGVGAMPPMPGLGPTNMLPPSPVSLPPTAPMGGSAPPPGLGGMLGGPPPGMDMGGPPAPRAAPPRKKHAATKAQKANAKPKAEVKGGSGKSSATPKRGSTANSKMRPAPSAR